MTIILHNPLSKNKKSKRTTKKVVDFFKENKEPFRLKSLLKIEDLAQYIKAKPKDTKLLLLGGDGTINFFINATYSMNITQEIFLKSNGSGNDFLRSLKKQNPTSQVVMKMHHNGQKQYFMNGSGIGIDGLISHRVNQSPNKNRFNYLYHTLRTFLTYKPRYMEVEIDGTLHRFKKSYLINVNSGEYIGGGMNITPNALLEEPSLDVIVVHNISRLVLIFIFLTVYFGKHERFKRYIFKTKAKHVKATMFSNQVAQCDGESYENTREFEASVTNKRMHFKPFTHA